MSTVYWIGKGSSSSAPASGDWNDSSIDGYEWSDGTTPDKTIYQVAYDVGFQAGPSAYTVTLDGGGANVNGTVYTGDWRFEVASMSILSGANVTLQQTATTSYSTGLLIDNALTNNGTVTFGYAALTYTAGSVVNIGVMNVNWTFTDNGAFANSGNLFGTASLSIGGGLSNTGYFKQSGGSLSITGQLLNQATFITSVGLYDNGQLVNSGTATISGTINIASGVTNYGTLQLSGNGEIYGAITNQGSLIFSAGSLLASGDVTDNQTMTVGGVLELAGTNLKGDGSLTLSNGELDNAIDQGVAIVGHGTLVNVSFASGGLTAKGGEITLAGAVVNSATVESCGSGGVLNITGDVLGLGNGKGFIEAVGGGATYVQAGSQIDAETLLATGSGSAIWIAGQIYGGTLETASSGEIEADGGLLGAASATVVNQGNVLISDVSGNPNSLTLSYNIVNKGVVTLSGLNAAASLMISGGVTLSGGGNIVMTDGGENDLYEATPNSELDNVDDQIIGNGFIGRGGLQLVNGGTIEAQGGSPLSIALSANNTSENDGLIGAQSGGELQMLRGNLVNKGTLAAQGGSSLFEWLGGALINSGTIEATGGGEFAYGTRGGLSNLVSGVLSGGTYEAETNSTIQLGAAIVSDAATLDLWGAGASIGGGLLSNYKTLEQSLTDIASNGVLSLSARNYTTANALTLEGDLQLGGTFSAASIAAASSSNISGTGNITATLNDAGAVSTSALVGSHVVTGTVAFSGAKDVFSGEFGGAGVVKFSAGSDELTSSLTVSSAIDITGASVKIDGDLQLPDLTMTGGYLTIAAQATASVTDDAILTGGVLYGPGILTLSDAAQVSGFAVSTGATIENFAATTEAGGTLMLGANATVYNTSAGVWDITDNSGVQGHATTSTFNNNGFFEKTGGTGVSVVSLAFSNGGTGSLLVSSGTLDFANAVKGTGVATIAGASTLEFASSVTQTVRSPLDVTFTGSGGELLLGSPTQFAAEISGYDAAGGGSSDTIALNGAWSLGHYTGSSGGNSGTLSLTSASSTASLNFLGAYSVGHFHASVVNGQTLITYA